MKLNHKFTREGIGDTPMLAAQDCIYIQAIGGDILRIKCQEKVTRQTSCVRYTPRDPGEIRKERGASVNNRILNANDGESSKKEGGIWNSRFRRQQRDEGNRP